MNVMLKRLVLGFLFASILWKGGKGLDAVWALALLAAVLTMMSPTSLSKATAKSFLMLLIGLLLWTFASFVTSTTLNYGYDEVLQAVSLTLLLLWAASARQEDGCVTRQFAETVSFAGLIACGIGLAVYILQPVSRYVGTFFDHRFHTDYWPNAWAEFLLFMWPILLFVLFTRNEKKLPAIFRRDWVKGVILGSVLACLLLSYSRGGFIALSGQIVLLFLLVVIFHRRALGWKRVPLTLLMTVVTSVILFSGINAVRDRFHDVQSVVRKATFTSDEGTSSVFERQAFWRQATMLASVKPLLGWGPYSFRFVQPHVQDGVLQTSDHPHNVFLKYASERGIPAAVLFLCIVAWALWSGLVAASRKATELPIDLFLVVSVAGVLAHNLIDYNLQFVGIALPMWIALGLMTSVPQVKKPSALRHRIERIVAIALLLFTLFEGMNLAMSSRARRAESDGSPLRALRWYALTDRSLFPRDAWLARGAMLLALNQLPQAEEAVDRSLGYNDEDGRAWRLLGDIYLRWNKRNDALRAYEKAYAYAKYDDMGITRGLIYLLKDQDREQLLARRHEFDLLLNEFGLAIEQNTHFIALGRNVEELISLCDILADVFPEDADAYRQLARRSQIHARDERAKTASRPRGLLW